MALLPASPVFAQVGSVASTPAVPMELPIEVEIELSPAGSLKQAPLWKELYQLLKNPTAFNCPVDDPNTLENESNSCTATIPRREGFGATMPPLNIFSPGYNFLTAQPMRRRTSDGEVSWDQPGPLFDPAENVSPDAFSTPTVLRTPLGHIVACPNPGITGAYQAVAVPADFCNGKPDGSLVVYNNTGSGIIPTNGTVVAVSAFVGGALVDEDGASITELEAPVNEEDFFRKTTDITGIPAALRPYVGRPGAEVLGKALFWDMQVGSDGVQACGSCHFHAGVDNRTKGQLNPNTLGDGNPSNLSLTVRPPNTDVVATDFPFHKGAQDSLATDSDDVMSSMGVSRFKLFNDIPPIGIANFLPAVNGIRAVAPDLGTAAPDPVAVNQGLRRVEPRNTPTMHGAAFNFDNFWDGRARFSYNGGSVFGPSDPTPHIFINPDLAPAGGGAFRGATMGDLRPDLIEEEPEVAEQPVRIKFSSLASQAAGPPLSDFEMSFAGRNWAKIGKKLLQGDAGAVQNFGNGAPQQAGTNRVQAAAPLANQLVATNDSRLGPFSNQGGTVCTALGRPVAANKPGLCISYGDLIRLAFEPQYWNRGNRHLNGTAAICTSAVNGVLTPAGCDPFDGFVLTPANGAANPNDTNQFTHMEANFTMFFGLAVQAYETLLIPDHTPADRFFDANPNAGHGVGEPGDQAVLFPTLMRDLMDDGQLNGSPGAYVTLLPDDPATPWYDAFGPDEVFGFDLFAGANLTAALNPAQSVDPISGRDRNPLITNSLGQQIRVGSNPFTRSAKCMLCHLGPEQTDHSINISHGLLKNDAEFEYPTPPTVADPTFPATFADGRLPSPEPSGSSRAVVGLILEEEVGEGVAQDAVEVEPRDFQVFDDPATPWDDRIIAQESNFGFGDQGVYNIGVRPIADDIGRGGRDAFGWPLSLSALTLKNIGGQGFEPCRGVDGETCTMSNFDPANIGAEGAPAEQQGFEETGDGAVFPGTTHTLQSINPGFERDPRHPQMPEHMAPWIHSLPAGELHPQIDEMAGMVPNTITAPNGGPGIEFPEILFGADFHCASFDPATFGMGPPNFGWGPPNSTARLCPQYQSGVAGNFAFPSQGTWPVPNRVMGDGAFKAPPLRNVEMSGPFFHTGSFLTLRQVVDFYFKGGDFPVTNKRSRDPHMVDLEMQAFAFGPSKGVFGGFDLLTPFDCSAAAPNDPTLPVVSCGPNFNYLAGSFGDGLPDTAFLYNMYPDSAHLITPEPVFGSRAAALEDAKNALVKFLLALTDPRVKLEKTPFDKPEMFVPIDGAAPENAAGRGTAPVAGGTTLVSLSGVACPVPGPNSGGACFRQIPATGAGGFATPLTGFLGVTSVPPSSPAFNCSMSAGPISHFCSSVLP
jgi:cytochrome c peroxidase